MIGRELVRLPYDERLLALLEAGVGLWDVVASASRAGSLDGNIRDHTANDLTALAASLPNLAAIAFNGGTAARIGQRQLGLSTQFTLVPLPSSSPAFTRSFDLKLAEWLKLRAYLDTG